MTQRSRTWEPPPTRTRLAAVEVAIEDDQLIIATSSTIQLINRALDDKTDSSINR